MRPAPTRNTGHGKNWDEKRETKIKDEENGDVETDNWARRYCCGEKGETRVVRCRDYGGRTKPKME